MNNKIPHRISYPISMANFESFHKEHFLINSNLMFLMSDHILRLYENYYSTKKAIVTFSFIEPELPKLSTLFKFPKPLQQRYID